MKTGKLGLAAVLGILAGLTGGPGTRKPKKSTKVDTRPKFDKDELAYLATLEGKEKKLYVKKLKEKYR